MIPSELRRLRRDLVRVNRRLALAHLEGIVAERDESKWMVRLELGRDEDDKPVLSPWLKPHAYSSGAFKDSPALPEKGDRMRMHSPSGLVGGASYAIPSAFDDELTRPEQEPGEHKRILGAVSISHKSDSLTHRTEETSLAQTKDKIALEAKTHEVKAKDNEQHAETREQFVLVLGGARFNIRPEALVPA